MVDEEHTMTQYKVFHPDHETLGRTLLDFEDAVGGENIQPYFQKHGLVNIDPDAWYPEQKLLDVLSDISGQKNSMFDLVSIGLKTVEQAVIPPEYASLPLLTILENANETYKLNCRGTDIGGVQCEVVSSKHVKMICRFPDPDDYWYGCFYGYVKRFSPRDTNFSLYYDKDIPRRDKGGDVTIIHITWD
jgi:hypothetical protein